MNTHPSSCKKCKYFKECSEEYGHPDKDIENCEAIRGCHICKAEWDGFSCGCSCSKNNLKGYKK